MIQRYKIGYSTDDQGMRSSTPGGIPAETGSWVRYSDHCEAVAAAVPESIKAAIKYAAAVLESDAGPLMREATAKGIRDTLRKVLSAAPGGER